MNDIVSIFQSRAPLNHDAIRRLSEELSAIKTLEEFKILFESCSKVENELDLPFINRKLSRTSDIWRSKFQRLSEVQENI